MPKWLVLGAIVAVVVIVAVMSWLNSRSLEQPDEASSTIIAQAADQRSAGASSNLHSRQLRPRKARSFLTATAPVWFQVSEKGGATLFSGMLQPGRPTRCRPTATAPVLKTGKPEALRINVGNAGRAAGRTAGQDGRRRQPAAAPT